MGGHRKGEVASALTVAHLGKRFTESASIGTKIDAVNWLSDNINEINKEILNYGEENENSKGLGTTVVAAIVTKDFLIFANIGDSSGYVIKNNKLHKVTKPHTLNLLVDAGDLTPEQAANHPKKNVLMKALGAAEKCEPDIFDVDNESNAVFLCSDGLTGMLSDEQIEKVLLDSDLTVEEKVVKLIKKCNARGGNDNISVAYLVRESGDVA
jgi:protein phosphatase